MQNPAAFNQKGFYTKITQNDSVCLGFDAEVPQKILQGLYYLGIPILGFKFPLTLVAEHV